MRNNSLWTPAFHFCITFPEIWFICKKAKDCWIPYFYLIKGIGSISRLSGVTIKKSVDYHHKKNLNACTFWTVHGKYFMILKKSCKRMPAVAWSFFLNFRQFSQKFSCCMKESHEICLHHTNYKHVSFCLNLEKSCEVNLETWKLMEVYFARFTRVLCAI